MKKIIFKNLNSWPHNSFLGRGRRELSPWGKATEEQLLQAPGLQGRENLPGWRLEEEFLVSAPERRGELGGGGEEGGKERNKTRKEKPARWREAEPGQGKMEYQC